MTKEEQICALYLQLGTYAKVREKTGCSYATISRALNIGNIHIGRGQHQPIKATDEQILQEIKDGLTRQQIADKYGMHVEALARRMKKLGVHARYESNFRIPPCQHRFQTSHNRYIWHYTESGEQYIQEKTNGQFEFVAYKERTFRVKCKKCESVFERSSSTIRRGGITCENCQKTEKELKEARTKLVRVLFCVKEIQTPKTCKKCGKIFYSQYPSAVYCTAKCRNKGKRKGSDFRSRCKKYGVYYDPNVTAEKIFKRDHYRCGICGLYCIKGDTSWNGYFGPYSPTVDHIVALANGGSHTWENVQCAHAICNSNKRDLITV